MSAAAVTGAPTHIVHLNSVSLEATPHTLAMIREAREQGLDITTEAYPYTAAMTDIRAAPLDAWLASPDSNFSILEWVATGERLTRESFVRHRAAGGLVVLHHNTEEMVLRALSSPLTMVASDGLLVGGRGHPRGAGTFARLLGRYVREGGALSLMEALRKVTLLPAIRLEARVPGMRNKGRLEPGADADIVVFDPERILDHATYREPATPSTGVRHLLVNGALVVSDGALVEGSRPGRPVRVEIGARWPLPERAE